MGAGDDSAALVGLLEQLGCGQGTLGAEGLTILHVETFDLLQGGDDDDDGGQLGFTVLHLILVERECLQDHLTHQHLYIKSSRLHYFKRGNICGNEVGQI